MTPRDPLDDLLDRWQPPADAVPDLRAELRREITRLSERERTSWVARLETVFARPSFAVAFVAACILLGLFLAEARVSRIHAAYGAQVARSYVQLIDPLLKSNAQRAALLPGAWPQEGDSARGSNDTGPARKSPTRL